MPADSLHYNALAKELDLRLRGGRIEKIIMPSKSEIILPVRANGVNYKLLISAATSPRCFLTCSSAAPALITPSFCAHLRRHLGSGIINSVSAVPFERILIIDVISYDELGSKRQRKLHIELMGKYSNVVLTDGSGKITDALKHISADEGRPILPGFYFHAPKVNKLAPDECEKIEAALKGAFADLRNASDADTADLRNASDADIADLRNASDADIADLRNASDADIERFFMDNVRGVSPVSVREVISTTRGSNNFTAKNLSKALITLAGRETNPTVYYDEKTAKEFSFCEYKTISGQQKSFESISAAMDEFYAKRSEAAHSGDGRQALIRTISGSIEKLKKRMGELEWDKEKASDYERDRIIGELITANLYRIKKGDNSAALEDWNTGEIVTVELGGESPTAVAEKKFARYHKKKRTVIKLEEQINSAKEQAEYYESILAEIEMADSDGLDDIRSELENAGIIKRQDGRKKVTEKSKPRTFIVDGYNLTVGKNNVQNDQIVQGSRGDDLWLHTQGIHGSHAVLRLGNKTPEMSTILSAAAITAFFSKARGSENVPVDYTKVKNVKKPKGAPPGKVEYVNQKTVYVLPKAPE